jgi:hypothetical protein
MVGSCLNAASAASHSGLEALTAAVAPWMERLDYLAAVYVLSASSAAFPLHRSLSVLAVIDQPHLVSSHVTSLLPHARDPSIGVSILPHEWHSLINYLCASCLEASADDSILPHVQQQLADAGICPPFAALFRYATPPPSGQHGNASASASYSFFLPPPAVLLAASSIDRACAAVDAGGSSAHWMAIWSSLYHQPPVEGHSSTFASQLTHAMLSAAATGTCLRSSGGQPLQLSKLFQAHAASRSLFAIMT